MIRTFETMGTVASLRTITEPPLREIEAIFAAADERFSLYRPDSEASRLARGELCLANASPQMRDAYAEALDWRTDTAGAFTPHRPDGIIDLAGTVKARAIADAGGLLDASGITDWLLSVGGDVLSRGGHNDGPWSLGIVDPDDRQHLLCRVPLSPHWRAVATSGVMERGEHIWRRPADPEGARFRQVTVLAADIIIADVLATAILSGGQPMLDAALERGDIDVLTCDAEGALLVSDRMRAVITAPLC